MIEPYLVHPIAQGFVSLLLKPCQPESLIGRKDRAYLSQWPLQGEFLALCLHPATQAPRVQAPAMTIHEPSVTLCHELYTFTIRLYYIP
jgi:hypothetical protein